MFDLPLNFIYMKYFCDAVRLGSVSAAAKKNFVTQSAVSQGIAKLERCLDCQLVAHHPNRFRINSDGEWVFEKAQKIFKLVAELEDELKTQKDTLTGGVDFACSHSIALRVLPGHLRLAKSRYPGLEVNFHLGNPRLIADMIKQGSIDFGLVLDNDDWSPFASTELFQGSFKLYVSKKIKKPASLPFILSEDRNETHRFQQDYKEKFGKDLNLLMHVSSWVVIANLVEEGLGIGLLPDYIARNRGKNLKTYDLELPPISYKMVAISPKSHSLSRQASAFLDLFKEML